MGRKGRIGAAASCAWRAGTSTWEGIAWRKEERLVSEDALRLVDDLEGTFLCRDPRTKRGLISPRGPCPVMFGVRATTREVASQATEILVQIVLLPLVREFSRQTKPLETTSKQYKTQPLKAKKFSKADT